MSTWSTSMPAPAVTSGKTTMRTCNPHSLTWEKPSVGLTRSRYKLKQNEDQNHPKFPGWLPSFSWVSCPAGVLHGDTL